jgi:hypothetical protein
MGVVLKVNMTDDTKWDHRKAPGTLHTAVSIFKEN